MEFKIDTKETFCTITPLNSTLSANLAGAIGEKCEEMRQSGSKNFIIDLGACIEADPASVDTLAGLHEECYGNEESLVFTSVSGKILAVMKENELDLVLNIAPTMQEAVDIISMEILERDIMREE